MCVSHNTLGRGYSLNEYMDRCPGADMASFVETSAGSRQEARLSHSTVIQRAEAEVVNSKSTGAPKTGFFEPIYKDQAPPPAAKPRQERRPSDEEEDDGKERMPQLKLVTDFHDDAATEDTTSFFLDARGNPIPPPKRPQVAPPAPKEETAHEAALRFAREQQAQSKPVEAEGVASQTDELSTKLEADAVSENEELDQQQSEQEQPPADMAALEEDEAEHQGVELRLAAIENRMQRLEMLLRRKLSNKRRD